VLRKILQRDRSKRNRHICWCRSEWTRLLWSVEDICRYQDSIWFQGEELPAVLKESYADARERMQQIARDLVVYKHWPPFLWRLPIWWYYRDYIPIARIG